MSEGQGRKGQKIAVVVVLAFMGLVMVAGQLMFFIGVNGGPRSLPFMYTKDKELVADLTPVVEAATPDGFSSEVNVMAFGEISVRLLNREGGVDSAVSAHRQMVELVQQQASVNPEVGKRVTSMSTTAFAGDARFEITGMNLDALEKAGDLGARLVGPALQVALNTSEPQLLVRAGWDDYEYDTAGTAGPCVAARESFVGASDEVYAVAAQGVNVRGDFMHCADDATGTDVIITADTPPGLLEDLIALVGSDLADGAFWAQPHDSVDLVVRYREGRATEQPEWQQRWPYGEVVVSDLSK